MSSRTIHPGASRVHIPARPVVVAPLEAADALARVSGRYAARLLLRGAEAVLCGFCLHIGLGYAVAAVLTGDPLFNIIPQLYR